MNTNLIEKFNGEINSVKINNSNIFSSIEYILDNMKKKLQALQYADQSAMQPGA